MNRRQLLSGAAWLAGAGQAHAFGFGELGAGEGHLGALGGAGGSLPPPPTGFVYLIDGDGRFLIDSDNSYLLDAA